MARDKATKKQPGKTGKPVNVVPKTNNKPKDYRARTKAAPVVTPGVETDPNESFDFKAQRSTDTTVYKLDKSRCVTTHELTTQQTSTNVNEKPVIRQFFTRPVAKAATATESATVDARGVFLSTKSHTIKVSNISQAIIAFTATAANSVNDSTDQIGLRTMIADKVKIMPGKSKTFKVNRMGQFPYKYIDSNGRPNEHVFDGYIEVPDAPPQDQSDIENTVSTMTDGTTVNRQTRIWKPSAEIAEISVRTNYLVQAGPSDYAAVKVAAHPIKFASDLEIPFGHTVATYLMPDGRLSTEVRTISFAGYDVAQDGWVGLGVAYLQDDNRKATVAYLAKFKQQTADKSALLGIPPIEAWEQMTTEEKQGVMDRINNDFPAFRDRKLEDSSFALQIPGGAVFSYDASGKDLGTASCGFRWSEEYMAFVLWDYSRARPMFIESGWAYPNYYGEWVACMPPVGFISYVNPGSVPSMIVNEQIDERFLMEKGITWDVAIMALTFFIEVIKGIMKIRDAMKPARAPQG